jgi:hypothetical protein
MPAAGRAHFGGLGAEARHDLPVEQECGVRRAVRGLHVLGIPAEQAAVEVAGPHRVGSHEVDPAELAFGISHGEPPRWSLPRVHTRVDQVSTPAG